MFERNAMFVAILASLGRGEWCGRPGRQNGRTNEYFKWT